jgi:hypothetical protein
MLLPMSKDVEIQIQELEVKLRELKTAQIAELKDRLAEAKKVVRDLEDQIENLSGKSTHEGRRKRTSSADVHNKIHSALKGAKGGLSQKEISDRSGIHYQTVALFLRKNQKEFRSTGEFKSKRYFLK